MRDDPIKKQEAPMPDLTRLKPYGDTMNDGRVQLSFTLPIPDGDRAVEAAKDLVVSMGLSDPLIAWHQQLDHDFTYFVAYGSLKKGIDYTKIKVSSVEVCVMTMEETDQFIREEFGRKIKVIGASTGTDAHTVGIDSIMNMKGYAGHYGLERYAMIEALNLGSQVSNEDFIREAIAYDADVMLVSQTVTQKEVHIHNITELVELLEAEALRDRFLLVVGGPRITHELAKELGCDAGFGPGKYAGDVASYLVTELAKRWESKR
ncbi:MAG TPA: OAM dimerization domain-containing protein [Clostridia bacterium]|nr:OAM dimerization domain-containing protein [Clostridia bacterium]